MSTIRNELGILGIDAGGTFTDVAFVSERDMSVLACGKTPTCRNDMPGTISRGLELILSHVSPDSIKCVNIATTFATNAIVENRSRSTALVLMGYDAERVASAERQNRFHTQNVLVISGAHDAKGNETAALDLEKLRGWLPGVLPHVEAVAVSGFFSVRNPSHELAVRDIITEMSPRTYVTCGHELASDLDAMLRAVTAALNADLIPVVMELLESVESVFRSRGINVPISIVKSDGNLVGLDWAKLHPIETILSGPAASAIGARHLAGAGGGTAAWVVDIGGTTTDIVYLDEEGCPQLNPEGAKIGEHRTLVKTIDVYTFGLGGDSRVSPRDRYGAISVGPKRVKSICSDAFENSAVSCQLASVSEEKSTVTSEPLIVHSGSVCGAADEFEENILIAVQDEPKIIDDLIEEKRISRLAMARIDDMEGRGLISLSGFTPTDALHVLGRLSRWDAEASKTAAAIITQRCEPIVSFCEDVCRTVVHDISLNLLRKSFLRAGRPLKREGEAENLISDALYGKDIIGPALSMRLDGVIVGAGAPAWAFINEVGASLNTKALLPEHAEVAGAVGAAVGRFVLKYDVLIAPLKTGLFRAHLPSGVKDFDSVDSAVEYSTDFMLKWMSERSEKAGAPRADIKFERCDEVVSAGGGHKIYMWSHLIFSAGARALGV